MDLAELSKRVVEELTAAIPADLQAGEREAISKIVQQGLLDASQMTHDEIKELAVMSVGSDEGKVRMLQEQLDKKRDMLIANLSSMR